MADVLTAAGLFLLVSRRMSVGSWRSPLRRAVARVQTAGAVMMIALLMLQGNIGCAGHNDATQQQEIADLKRTVERMNARLEQLEEQGSAPPSPSSMPSPEPAKPLAVPAMPAAAATPPADSPAGLRQRWRTLAYGMSFDQVGALLGQPQRTIDEHPKTIWYYSYPDVGSGSIVFIDEHGVTDWQNPPFGNWAWWP